MTNTQVVARLKAERVGFEQFVCRLAAWSKRWREGDSAVEIAKGVYQCEQSTRMATTRRTLTTRPTNGTSQHTPSTTTHTTTPYKRPSASR